MDRFHASQIVHYADRQWICSACDHPICVHTQDSLQCVGAPDIRPAAPPSAQMDTQMTQACVFRLLFKDPTARAQVFERWTTTTKRAWNLVSGLMS